MEPCVLAGTEPDDFVLDPFFGCGTVGLVCRRLKRRFIGIELNPEYVDQAMELLEKQSLNRTSKRRLRYHADKHSDRFYNLLNLSLAGTEEFADFRDRLVSLVGIASKPEPE